MKNSMDNLSYDKLLENEEFINNTRSVLYDSFGEDHILSTDKEVVDAFYENFREVDTNVVDAYQLWSATNGDLDEAQKDQLRQSYEVYRALPSFWEDDSASNVQAFWDYASAIFTDPATYLGIATGGIASVATKASAYGAVRAGLQTSLQVGRKATLNSAMAGVATDTVTSVLTDAEIQGVERRINYREDGYDFGQAGLAAAAAIVPGAAIGLTGRGLKALSKSDTMMQNVAEGKRIYLENSEAGKAFLDGKVVEGSFVQVNDRSIVKGDAVDRMAYVDSINTDKNTYTVNVGFDELGDAITKEVNIDKVKLVDPFDAKVTMKIERQIQGAAKVYNTERAKLGYKDFQKEMKEVLEARGVTKEELDELDKGVEFVLSESAVKRVNGAFLDIIQDSGISYNPNKAISVMVEDVLANQPKGFNASEFVKILDSHGVSNIEMLGVMMGETLSKAYRGTVYKSASTLGKLSGLSKKARKIAIEKELDVTFGGNFQKITGGMRTEAGFRGIKDGRQYAEEVIGTTELSKETEAYYTSLLAERNNIDKMSKVYGPTAHRGDQWNRMIRLGMIAQPATTCRNVMGGLIRTPMDCTTRTFDNIITMAMSKITGNTIRPVNLSDGFEHLTSLLSPQEYNEMAKLIMSKKPLAAELIKGPEGYLQTAKIAQTMNGDKGGFVNKVLGYGFDPLERGLIHANVLNSVQDKYMKSQSFIVGLRQSMSRENLDLDDFIRTGRIQDIDDRFIADGMQWAMEYNYQANIRGDNALTRFAVETINKLSNVPYVGSALAPFPKFMINSMKFMYEHSPVGLPESIIKMKKGFGKEGNTYLQQEGIKALSRQASGASLLLMAYAIRTSELGGDLWHDLIDDTGNTQDISTWYPLAPALWFADGIVQFGEQLDGKSNMGDFKEAWLLDTMKALGGPSSRSGIWKELDKNFLEGIISGDANSKEELMNGMGRAMGTIIGALGTPLKLGSEILAETNAFGFDDMARVLHDARSSQGFKANFLDSIFKNVPYGYSMLKSPYNGIMRQADGTYIFEEDVEYSIDIKTGQTTIPRTRYSVLNPEPLTNVSPLGKQVYGGFRKRRRNRIEKEFERLGLAEWRLFKRTNIPEYDQALAELTGNFSQRILQNYMESDDYFNMNDSGKRDAIKSRLNDAKGYVAKEFNSLFHLGLLGTLDKLGKRPRNDGVVWMQNNGVLPRLQDERAEYISNFEFTKDETDLLVTLTKIFKSKNTKR
tara:strand:+ start:2879 stop:6562 length:3684 start_codon:yes stop_codon:yes gene_type:complete